MTDALSIIAQVCKDLNSTGYTTNPRIVAKADFDLTKFKEQDSGYTGVQSEWVHQVSDGITDDGFFATVVVPIDELHFFVLQCNT